MARSIPGRISSALLLIAMIAVSGSALANKRNPAGSKQLRNSKIKPDKARRLRTAALKDPADYLKLIEARVHRASNLRKAYEKQGMKPARQKQLTRRINMLNEMKTLVNSGKLQAPRLGKRAAQRAKRQNRQTTRALNTTDLMRDVTVQPQKPAPMDIAGYNGGTYKMLDQGTPFQAPVNVQKNTEQTTAKQVAKQNTTRGNAMVPVVTPQRVEGLRKRHKRWASVARKLQYRATRAKDSHQQVRLQKRSIAARLRSVDTLVEAMQIERALLAFETKQKYNEVMASTGDEGQAIKAVQPLMDRARQIATNIKDTRSRASALAEVLKDRMTQQTAGKDIPLGQAAAKKAPILLGHDGGPGNAEYIAKETPKRQELQERQTPPTVIEGQASTTTEGNKHQGQTKGSKPAPTPTHNNKETLRLTDRRGDHTLRGSDGTMPKVYDKNAGDPQAQEFAKKAAEAQRELAKQKNAEQKKAEKQAEQKKAEKQAEQKKAETTEQKTKPEEAGSDKAGTATADKGQAEPERVGAFKRFIRFFTRGGDYRAMKHALNKGDLKRAHELFKKIEARADNATGLWARLRRGTMRRYAKRKLLAGTARLAEAAQSTVAEQQGLREFADKATLEELLDFHGLKGDQLAEESDRVWHKIVKQAIKDGKVDKTKLDQKDEQETEAARQLVREGWHKELKDATAPKTNFEYAHQVLLEELAAKYDKDHDGGIRRMLSKANGWLSYIGPWRAAFGSVRDTHKAMDRKLYATVKAQTRAGPQEALMAYNLLRASERVGMDKRNEAKHQSTRKKAKKLVWTAIRNAKRGANPDGVLLGYKLLLAYEQPEQSMREIEKTADGTPLGAKALSEKLHEAFGKNMSKRMLADYGKTARRAAVDYLRYARYESEKPEIAARWMGKVTTASAEQLGQNAFAEGQRLVAELEAIDAYVPGGCYTHIRKIKNNHDKRNGLKKRGAIASLLFDNVLAQNPLSQLISKGVRGTFKGVTSALAFPLEMANLRKQARSLTRTGQAAQGAKGPPVKTDKIFDRLVAANVLNPDSVGGHTPERQVTLMDRKTKVNPYGDGG